MDKKRLELLYRSFDSALNENEKAELAHALSSDEELREEQRKLHVLRTALAKSAVSSFQPFFAERVANRIARPVQREYFYGELSAIFRRVLLIGGFAVLLLISANLLFDDSAGLSTGEAQSQTLEEVYLPTFTPSWEEML